MNSSNSAARTSRSPAHPTPSYTVILMDGTRLKTTSKEFAIQLRQERNSALKRLRQVRIDTVARWADSKENARIRRELEAEERDADRQLRKLSKVVVVKVEHRARRTGRKSSRSLTAKPSSASSTPRPKPQGASALALRDSNGHEAVMLIIAYVRAGGRYAALGCLGRHWLYITRDGAVTLDDEGQPIIASNLGETIEEVREALALQESILRELRKNGKLGFRITLAIPYGFPLDAQRELLQRLGEELFGSRGLPWSGAVHGADPEAEADNPHIHLDYGLLPIQPMGDGTFLVSNDLRTDLDGKEGLRFIRHKTAEIMSGVAQDFGLDRKFTGQSYRERGIAREGGEHVGQIGTAAHRRGEYVPAIARNEARRQRDDAREKLAKARRRGEALERLKTSLDLAAPHIATMAEIPVLTDIGNEAPSFSNEPVLECDVKAQAPLQPVRGVIIKGAAPNVADLSAIDPAPEMAMPPNLGERTLPTPAPVIGAVPVITNIGEAFAPSLPPTPHVIRIGYPAPQARSAAIRLWSVGHEIKSDPEDEAIFRRLTDIVKRESQRRHEAATAKPLDPFDETGKVVRHSDFEKLLALLANKPAMLVVDEGEIYPGDGLPDHLRKAMHGYAAHPRARARMLNVVEKAKAESSKLAAGNLRHVSGAAKVPGTASPETSKGTPHQFAQRTTAEILAPWLAAARSAGAITQLSEPRIRQLREKHREAVKERSAVMQQSLAPTTDRTLPDG